MALLNSGRRALVSSKSAVSNRRYTSPARLASRSCCSSSSRAGRCGCCATGTSSGRPFLDIHDLISSGGERGLLSIAFPPDYRQSGRFYVYDTDPEGNIRIDEFRRGSATRAARGSRRAVVRIPHPVNSNHNGGQLQFLGNWLYFGTGDGGSGGDPPNNAQNPHSRLGKLLRFDQREAHPKPRIYSIGLRNPFRFSFDRVTDPGHPRIAIGDVGQNRFEEVDYLPVGAARGANFGWDAFEGFVPYEEENSGTPDPGGTVKPIFAYPTPAAAAARSSAATSSPIRG